MELTCYYDHRPAVTIYGGTALCQEHAQAQHDHFEWWRANRFPIRMNLKPLLVDRDDGDAAD